jgi:zinc protease
MRLDTTTLRDFALPPLREFETAGGLRVIVARRRGIPLATARLCTWAGSATDPARKRGLADFTATLLRRGTRRMRAEQVDEAIEFWGGNLGTAASEDFAALQVSGPVEHFPKLLNVFGQIVLEPGFPQREVVAARERLIAQIVNDLDDPAQVASRAVGRALWGDHPYGHPVEGSIRDVRTFTRSDAIGFHRKRFGPKASVLVIVGDIAEPAVRAAVEGTFGRWRGEAEGPPALEKRESPARQGEALLVHKPEQTQTQVRLAALAFPKGDPDSFPAEVLETVLGGVFTSRLMQAIRVERGLSYGANSSFDSYLAGGSLIVSTFTKTETTREIIEVALGEITKLREEGPTRGEMRAAQTYLAGLFPLRLETNEALAGAIGELKLYGLPEEWVTGYRRKITELIPEQIVQVARKYLAPDRFTFALVGDAPAVARQVRGLIRTRVRPISDLR